ncbi:disease resistance protein RPS2 [Striga asiatica]|uniref:Disease resistance protein RPS2 n=1 Tax=Striga asiatica TaxID=4170 RepID=A0A5A7QNA4_STRAF|nr:disease resistance protein RPS2 [Striga asiatica]
MALGELFLSAFIQVLFQQLASAATMALARREKVESHFKKLSQSLTIIQAVLDDAEEKQLTEKSVKVWLESLRDLAYDLDDLLDEITTRALVQDSEEHSQNCNRTSKIWRFIPTCSSYMPGTLVSNYRLMSRIKETNSRLQNIVKQRVELNLQENVRSSCTRSTVPRLPSTSLVNESYVYGRDEDKEKVIRKLLANEDDNDDISVIPIVGMGGIGKTTLAQIVYNDRSVKDSFHVRAWVCVTEEFDVITITKTVYESVTGLSSQSRDLDTLQVSLKDRLAKTRFLIVLDDLWNEDYGKWDDLYRPFQFGLPGSRIIVTTRNDSVASVVRSPRAAYHMKLLTDEDCLSLLAQHARMSFHENLELRDVGLGLAKKCKGLPLAAKTLGGLLRSKETKEEWENVLSSKIWDLPEHHNILPVLRLSYHHLPSHLKHLFAYCSIFPKDYEFDRDELVLLWMGEGFLEQPNPRVRKEELGLQYFNELLSRSFFQRLGGSDSCFVMHDLINDLAQFVAGGTCYRLDEKMDTSQEYRVPEKARHGSFLRHEYEVLQKFRTFYQVQGLRTFLPMPVQNSLVWPPFYLSNRILVELVPKLGSLRVLSLSGYSITELPSSICNLLHLRYLNLSGTSIVTLPDTLSGLFHLQTLSLRNCRFICKLPPALGSLSNLRHLDNSNTDQLKDMPVEIGNLRNLQTLPKIVLSKEGGCLGLKQLRDMRHLRGSLAVFELQNVMDIEDVKEANFRCKNDLDELQLSWGSEIDNSNNDKIPEEDVIDHLLPHENLKSLKIEFYRGLNFPSWIGDPAFRKLSSIIIGNCSECSSLPPLGQLPELKHLRVGGMPKIKQVGTEFYGTGTIVTPFPKLENLRFDNMPEWQKWAGPIEFPNLQHLSIFKCGKLAEVSPLTFPSLRTLDVEECGMVLLESFSGLESLNYLKIESIFGLSHLPAEVMKSLVALEVLECCSCSELLSLWPEGVHLSRLRRLVIASCPQLVSLGQGDHQLPPNLEVLELFRCANLDSLPNNLSELESLRELIIKNCQKFVAFPENGIPRTLKRLEILSCNSLESLPANISGLERLEIKECSSLGKWAVAHFPATLKKLSIKNCAQLETVTEGMFPEGSGGMLLEDLSLCNWTNFNNLLERLHGFAHLVELYLSSCLRLKHFPENGLPSGLRALSIEDCPSLKSLPAKIRTMKSLVSLELRSCPRLDNFPRFDLPPNLTSLRIWDSKKFKPLSKWGLHRLASLREFSICGGFKEVELLGEDDCLFPPSLIKFSIARFPKLASLGKVLENLTLLRHLLIMNCQNLNVLPGEALLEKLWHLEISDCPLLRQRCAKDKGDYWPKIAGIPCVEIDGTYVYKQGSDYEESVTYTLF